MLIEKLLRKMEDNILKVLIAAIVAIVACVG